MKIGFFTETYSPRTDGVAVSIETFRRELEEMGHEVYIFAPQPNRRWKETQPRVIRFPSIRGLPLEENIPHGMFFPPAAIKKVEQVGLDVVHFHSPSPIGLLGAHVALKHGLPLFTTYHTDYYEYVKHYPSTFPGVLGLSLVAPLAVDGNMDDYRTAISMIKPEKTFDEWAKKMVSRMSTVIHNRCDMVIAPSAKIKHQLASWGTTVPIEIVPTGVDPLPAEAGAVNAFKERIGIGPKDQVILMVGRLGAEKNIETLMQAFALIAPQLRHAKLVLVGEHPIHQKVLQKLAKNLGLADRIIFTGRIDHSRLGAVYAAADLLAFPSLTDTQGLVVNEAAHAGLPIVMIDRLITEVVRDGVNGFYAQANPQDLAAKISQILTNPQLAKSMGQASQELASDFTAGKQAAKLLRLYEKVLGGKFGAKKQKPKNR